MRIEPQGVISYAGLDLPTLLAGARLMFSGEETQLPPRFSSLMPLFPVELVQSMRFVGAAAPGRLLVSPSGFSTDPAEYHTMLYEQMPRLYVGDNLSRNMDYEGNFHGRGEVTVDEAWTTCFPQYQPFAGERLMLYALGGGAQSVVVPESLYPRAAGMLRTAETALGVTNRCHDYARYVYQRIRAGESFDAVAFENDYLSQRELKPVVICQSDLGRMMQDLAMLRSIREGSDEEGLYTENAKRAERIQQYVPSLYACDVFDDAPQTRYTSRLLQPVWEDGFVSDWWLPYTDAAAYISRSDMTLDMAALCSGFQFAPVYDPETRGGRYPAKVRVVVVRDREIRLRMGDTLNNPAYGSGMSPLGTINKMVYIPDSRELLRQGKLTEEESGIRCENTSVRPAAYRQMVKMASLQENKGRLVDALYRRESVLGEVFPVSPEYEQIRALMNEPVDALDSTMAGYEHTQLSGYDADIDYLRRMGMEREWHPEDPRKPKPFRFALDALRQASIESGFAMRASCVKVKLKELRLENPGEDDPAGAFEMGAFAQSAADGNTEAADGNPPTAGAGDAEAADSNLPTAGAAGTAGVWMSAADGRYLTTDVGGTYPTDEELAQKAAEEKKKAKPVKRPKQQKDKADSLRDERSVVLDGQLSMELSEPISSGAVVNTPPSDGNPPTAGAAGAAGNTPPPDGKVPTAGAAGAPAAGAAGNTPPSDGNPPTAGAPAAGAAGNTSPSDGNPPTAGVPTAGVPTAGAAGNTPPSDDKVPTAGDGMTIRQMQNGQLKWFADE